MILLSLRTLLSSKRKGIDLKPNIDDIQTKRITTHGLICDRPCWVFCLIGVSYQSTSSLLNVHDGRTDDDPIKLDLSPSQAGSDIMVFNTPVYFPKGIYVKFAENGYSCFAQFVPEY